MNKIASPQDLQAELRRLLAYAQTEKPSREKLAAEMRGLANRVAADVRLGSDVDELDAIRVAERIKQGIHGGRAEAKDFLFAVKRGDPKDIRTTAEALYAVASNSQRTAEMLGRWWEPSVVVLGVYLTKLRQRQ